MSGSSDKSVRVWDVGKRECVQTLQELNHSDQVLLSDLCFPHHRFTSISQIWGVALSGGLCFSVGDDGAACLYSTVSRP